MKAIIEQILKKDPYLVSTTKDYIYTLIDENIKKGVLDNNIKQGYINLIVSVLTLTNGVEEIDRRKGHILFTQQSYDKNKGYIEQLLDAIGSTLNIKRILYIPEEKQYIRQPSVNISDLQETYSKDFEIMEICTKSQSDFSDKFSGEIFLTKDLLAICDRKDLQDHRRRFLWKNNTKTCTKAHTQGNKQGTT